MAKSTSCKRRPKKNRKSKCPRAKDFTFCLGDCNSRFRCDLPNMDHKSQGRKSSFGKKIKKHEQELWFHVKQAESELRRAHGEGGLV